MNKNQLTKMANYKIGDLVFVKSQRQCGEILTYQTGDDGVLYYEVLFDDSVSRFVPSTDIEHNQCEKRKGVKNDLRHI
jgi:hypothetical protein